MAPVARIDNGFIKTSFLEAAQRKDFQNQWMSSEFWAKLIAKYCITDSTLNYNGTELDKYDRLTKNLLFLSFPLFSVIYMGIFPVEFPFQITVERPSRVNCCIVTTSHVSVYYMCHSEIQYITGMSRYLWLRVSRDH